MLSVLVCTCHKLQKKHKNNKLRRNFNSTFWSPFCFNLGAQRATTQPGGKDNYPSISEVWNYSRSTAAVIITDMRSARLPANLICILGLSLLRVHFGKKRHALNRCFRHVKGWLRACCANTTAETPEGCDWHHLSFSLCIYCSFAFGIWCFGWGPSIPVRLEHKHQDIHRFRVGCPRWVSCPICSFWHSSLLYTIHTYKKYLPEPEYSSLTH